VRARLTSVFGSILKMDSTKKVLLQFMYRNLTKVLATICHPSVKVIMHLRKIQFGQYLGQTFKWVFENVVGCTAGFVNTYAKKGTTNISALGVNKRLFCEHCMAQAVDFSSRVASASTLAKDTGDNGHRLIKFSSYYCDVLEWTTGQG